MAESNFSKELEEIIQSVATVAGSLNRKIGVFAFIGLVASFAIAYLVYSADSSLGWNLVKCGIVMLPAVVICIIWQTLTKLVDAPNQLSVLTKRDGDIVTNFKTTGLKGPKSIRGLISTIRTIRNDENLGNIAQAIGGIALLANPAFLFVTFISIAFLLVLIIVAPFVLIL